MSAVQLPYATAKSLRILGKIRQEPADFRVDELPAYAPAGHGDHLLVRFEKVGLNTQDAVRRIALALDVDPDASGVAGLKDRVAITTQWASFLGASAERARALELPDVRVLDAAPHPHKLRTGHLRGNRFELRVRGAGAAIDDARTLLDQLVAHGAPNFYGEQRFGIDARNLERARHWLIDGGRAPRKRFERKLLVSVLQSAAFNEWLSERMAQHGLGGLVQGDIARKEDTGGLFEVGDLASEQPRADAWAISATGPMFGSKMRSASGPAGEAEARVLARFGGEPLLARLGRLGEGSRRVIRMRPDDVAVARDGDDLSIAFELPKGAYATIILRELLKPDDAAPQ